MQFRDIILNHYYLLKKDAALRMHRNIIQVIGYTTNGCVMWCCPLNNRRGYINAHSLQRELKELSLPDQFT